ncbi:HdeD family acid-resistance protein [Streptomyces phaeofaciens JCM 4814]|uniref:Membrane protein n=1 Tax=Streptomyces phaeofaciens TaxID=68254 RepID=A0A918M220_9ACTN|nr:DUF308 domain-containing protein [Streptomyces phaeofaciens]GGT98413.1 membrane protein [Streptomyces phaeofaciens]
MVVVDGTSTGPGEWNESSISQLLRTAVWQLLVGGGVVATVVGLITLIWPRATLIVVGVLFGVYLLAYGVTQLVGAFAPHAPVSLRAVLVLSGTLSMLLGLMCFRSVTQSLLLLAFWIGFSWLLRGISLTTAAVAGPAGPARTWSLFVGVLSVLAGITVVVWPFPSIASLTVVSGIWLLVIGVAEVIHGLQVRRHIITSAA